MEVVFACTQTQGMPVWLFYCGFMKFIDLFYKGLAGAGKVLEDFDVTFPLDMVSAQGDVCSDYFGAFWTFWLAEMKRAWVKTTISTVCLPEKEDWSSFCGQSLVKIAKDR